MKRRSKRFVTLILAGLLAAALVLPAAAFDVPDGYWEVRQAWFDAHAAKDVDAFLAAAPKVYDLLANTERDRDLCNDVLHPLCSRASWLCEMRGDLDGAVLWLERQLEADRWLDAHGYTQTDNLLDGAARMNHLQRQMEVYVLTDDPADVPYYGSIGEPVSGVYYGTVPGVTHQNDSAALVYVEFKDGYSMRYWLTWYADHDSVTRAALNSGGVVEVAWNFKQSDAGLDEVLASDSYIAESMRELGSRNCTVLLRPGAEMNGGWTQLPDRDKFISAYRKIAAEARKYDNIALVYSPNDISHRSVDYSTYYPGDAYVDWIGVSTYNRGVSGKGAYEYDNAGYNYDAYYCVGLYGTDPTAVLQDLAELAEAHKKPMMISECGFAYRNRKTGADQTAYAADRMNKFYSYIPMIYPQVKAMFYFDNNVNDSEFDYALSGSSAVAAVYREKVTGGPFIQNGARTGKGYTRLSAAKVTSEPVTLYTYVSFPGEGTTTVKYYVDGVLQGTVTKEPFALTLNTEDLALGSHTVKITASKGNFTKTITRTFTRTAAPGDVTFTDVKTGDWFYAPVKWAVKGKITVGTTNTTFSPTDNCKVAQILTFLWRAKGCPEPSITNPFADVKPEDYFYKAALWAYENNLVDGTAFEPYKDCTRSMVVTYLWKLRGRPAAGSSAFTDVPATAAYAAAVSWAVENGITVGTSDTTFTPDQVCNRAQIVTFLYRDAGLA